MQLPTVFAALMALTLAAPALAAPGLSPNNDLNTLSKRGVSCGINTTEPGRCPDGFHCACAVVLPVRSNFHGRRSAQLKFKLPEKANKPLLTSDV